MKALIVLLFAVCYVQCRKTYQPLDKNANLDFINMEGGGGARPRPASPQANVPVNGPPVNPPSKPVAPVTPKPVAPASPKPVVPATVKSAIIVTPPSPTPSPALIKPQPVNPKPVAIPISTPGPGSVKQLVNFYDSQGKASPIRPYSYSQAVKQG